MIAECAVVLHTPIPYFMDAEWDEVLRWHEAAREIAEARGL